MNLYDVCPNCGINLWDNPAVVWEEPWLFVCDCGERTKVPPDFMWTTPVGRAEGERIHALRMTLPVRWFQQHSKRAVPFDLYRKTVLVDEWSDNDYLTPQSVQNIHYSPQLMQDAAEALAKDLSLQLNQIMLSGMSFRKSTDDLTESIKKMGFAMRVLNVDGS